MKSTIFFDTHKENWPRVRAVQFPIVLLVAAAVLTGCSSTRDSTGRSDADTSADRTATLAQIRADHSFPKLPVEFDSLPAAPDVNLADIEPLLDRARLHLVLASKALESLDTTSAVGECNLAFEKLDRASYLPGMDRDSGFAELTRSLMNTYRLCASAIDRRMLDVPMEALEYIAGVATAADTTDLSAVSFREPPPTTIPLPLNKDVERNIIFFSTRMKNNFGKWLERSARYFPLMRPILLEEGMPEEIIFLTMIESGVNPRARSWAKCVGLWQFLKSTGEMYGLRGDWYTDDRRDPEKATRAAARHLRDLYNRYKDWHLALAAYNAGAGRIDRALQRARVPQPNYWDIQEFLPLETQNYVPRYVAAAIIALNPESYDFTNLNYPEPLEYDVTRIEKSYKVDDLADAAGLSVEEFLDYNSFLLQPVTPPHAKTLDIYVPKGRAQTFASNIVNYQPVKAIEMEYHTVRKGETIAKVAKLYGLTVAQIRSANGMKHTRRLTAGEMLRVPKLSANDNLAYTTAMDNLSSSSSVSSDPLRRTSGKERSTLTVEKGMTLGGIANRYYTTVSDLMIWNSMAPNEPLVPGRELVIWVRPGTNQKSDQLLASEEQRAREIAAAEMKAPGRSFLPQPVGRTASFKENNVLLHRVESGQTLVAIAKKYGVSVQNLKRWNELRTSRVRPGKVLQIRREQNAPVAKPTLAEAVPAAPQPAVAKAVPPSEASESEDDEEDVRTGAAVEEEDDAIAETTAAAGNADEAHTVTKGETLWSVAQTHGATLEQVRKWNRLSGDALQAGQKLLVKAPDGQAKTTSDIFAGRAQPVIVKEKPKTYIVRKGDNLWGIAKSFGLSVEQLSLWNGIGDLQVQAGQELRLTAPDSKSAASGKQSSETAGKQTQKSENAGESKTQVHAAAARMETPSKDNDNHENTSALNPAQAQSTYIVRKGDNLWSISKEFGVSREDLREWNKLPNDRVKIGQELRLEKPAETGAGHKTMSRNESTRETTREQQRDLSPATLRTGQNVYVVKQGDTLYSIARRLGVRVADLEQWNSLNDVLKPGQELTYQNTQQ